MGWRDHLRPASFRGVPFRVLSVSTAIGRRNVLHQYPFKDEPYLEDLGADADEYRVEGYIVQWPGNSYDYFGERDALMDALKQKGPGTLVHPFLGELQVGLLGKAQVTESFSEGGIARFAMVFVKAGTNKYPSRIPDYVEDVDDACERATDYTKDGFGLNWLTESVPGHVWADIVEYTKDGMDMMRSAVKTVKKAGASAVAYADSIIGEYRGAVTLSVVADAANLLDSVIGTFDGYKSLAGVYGNIGLREVVGEFSGRVRSFVYGPVEEETALTGTVSKGMGISTVDACLEVSRYGEPPGMPSPSSYGGWLEEVPLVTITKARQSLNQKLLIFLFRSMAIIIAAQIAIRIPYDSADEAIEVMEKIVEALDALLVRLGDEHWEDYEKYGLEMNNNDFFEGLQYLRPVFVNAMIGIGANLASVVQYYLKADVESTLVLAYDRYEDLEREAQIIDGNRPMVKHPGFLPGGVALEVLSE